MKKILLTTALAFAFSINAQVLQSENFNELTIGNIGSNFAGESTGQGDWFTFSVNGTAPTTSTNAANENFQVVSSGNASLGLQLTGPDGDKGERYMWKDGLAASWASRVTGNNIVEVEVDINPGPGTSLSRNVFGVYIFNADYSRVLAGFFVRAATRELFLVAYSTPTGNPVGNYNYSLAAAPGIQLPADVFSRVGVSYNKTTGQVIIKGPGIDPAGLSIASSSPNTDPAEIDFISLSGNTTTAPNASEFSMSMDNFIVKASATDNLLSSENNFASINFSIYPNPASDFINVNAGNLLVNAVQITDLNGRVVKNITTDAMSNVQVDIQDLNAGLYLMSVFTNEGVGTSKIVKK